MSSYIPRKFFRIMRNEDLQNGEIRVPKEFVELHWKSVSNPVVFILPNGATQEIYWVKRNGDIWFQKNWEKFAKFLEFRYKVNFEYFGGSYFKIEIYGVNTLEIDYSNIKFIDEVNGGKEVEEPIEVSDDSDKSLDESEIPTQTQRIKNGKRKMIMDSNANHQTISGSNRGDMNKKAKKCSTSKANGRDDEIEEVELSDDIDESDIPTQIQRTKNGKRKDKLQYPPHVEREEA
ncbi:B3 DNA-binding domain protein [Trifolium medium]|uniref:B3 DNA-binding domain protein n=1 Tax=Trifolium medium TaxID=97028 RepID=A0A392M2L3_9FABA|nr:B3 DNA-binding domain protein [Trifolium medium]